jgi:hypothetical protein
MSIYEHPSLLCGGDDDVGSSMASRTREMVSGIAAGCAAIVSLRACLLHLNDRYLTTVT